MPHASRKGLLFLNMPHVMCYARKLLAVTVFEGMRRAVSAHSYLHAVICIQLSARSNYLCVVICV
jgi:hypothetical protein